MNTVAILQTSISPVILISGTALLILTLTNRLGRTIDRARSLMDADETEQVEILWKRAKLIRLSIILASLSALSSALLITSLFLTVLMGLQADWIIILLFLLCLLFLTGSLAAFISEVNKSLEALKLELNKK